MDSEILGLKISPYNEHLYIDYQEIFTDEFALKLKWK
jgi:hypothetical protein